MLYLRSVFWSKWITILFFKKHPVMTSCEECKNSINFLIICLDCWRNWFLQDDGLLMCRSGLNPTSSLVVEGGNENPQTPNGANQEDEGSVCHRMCVARSPGIGAGWGGKWLPRTWASTSQRQPRLQMTCRGAADTSKDDGACLLGLWR